MNPRVETLWSNVASQRQTNQGLYGWLDSPLMQRLYVQPLTKAGQQHRILALVEQLGIPKDGCWLSIGCGGGGLEVLLVEQGFCAEMNGIDVASGAIAVAQRTASERGLNNVYFRVGNLERSQLVENNYDVILCAMGLHHISRLEFFYEEVVKALKPGGWLILDEYVGPSQWQWTQPQLAAINTLLAALPERLRVHAVTGAIKECEERPSIAAMNIADPSESIRSADILPLLQPHFDIIEQRDYGGTVLHKLLEYIVGNFDEQQPEDVALLTLLCASEQALLRSGALQSDFTLLAARNTKRSLRKPSLPLNHSLERHLVYGLYPSERTPQGYPFCWTEPDATLVLARPAHTKALRLVLVLPPVERTLSIWVGNILIGSLQTYAGNIFGTRHQVMLMLPVRTSTQITIHLQLNSAWIPHEVWQNGDHRLLGVAVYVVACI